MPQPLLHPVRAELAAHVEIFRERVHRLGADAVQAHAELEHVVVILRARVDLRHAVDHLAQRNAAPEITHLDVRLLDSVLDLLAVAHDVFVDGVIDHLLQQHVAAVIVMRAISDAPDVHARAQTDMFEG